MTLTAATIVLLLAEKIHGTAQAIRKSAKNMTERLPRSKRDLMYGIAEGKNPRDLMRHMALGPDSYRLEQLLTEGADLKAPVTLSQASGARRPRWP